MPLTTPLHDECTMGDLLIRAVARGGDRIAFVSNGKRTSYREFGALLSKLMQFFEAEGLRRGDGIACLSSNRMEAFAVVAVCYLIGLRVTNMHPMVSLEDHAFMLEDSGAKALFFDPGSHGVHARELTRLCPGVKMFALAPGDGPPDAIAAAGLFSPVPLQSEAQLDDVSWLFYTGGTTGRSKGVVHTHRTHLALLMAELAEWEWPSYPVFLAITPISHGAGGCIMPVLMKSGTVVMENGFSPSKFFEIVERDKVSATFLVPTMIYKMLDHAAEHPVTAESLQLVIYGAAPMAPTRLREALARFGSVFMQLYGQAEAPGCVTVLRKQDHESGNDERLTSCGSPIFTSQVCLLDGEGRPVGLGETGEICVRGPLVMRGYWNRPEETTQAFRHGWLHTGDLARQDADGYLYIVGRSKDMIISGGFNVFPAEVEDVLTAHPAVSAAAVIGVADPVWGEAVKAIVMLRPGHEVQAAELIALVRRAKGAVHAPKSVDFVSDLPVTSLGKPDKKLLRQRYAEQA